MLPCAAYAQQCKHVLDCLVFNGENEIEPVGEFCSRHNFDGDDLPVLKVKIKFTPNWFDFTFWFSQNTVKIKEIKILKQVT